MNRAILIVICDFLVSSMLTMMTGMMPGYSVSSGGGQKNITPGMYKSAQIVYDEIDDSEEEALRKELEEANDYQQYLESKLSELNAFLEDARNRLDNQEKGYVVLNQELIRSRSALDEANKKLNSSREELIAETRKYHEVKEKLTVSESLRERAEKDVAESKAELKETQNKLLDETAKHGQTKTELGKTKVELDASKRDLNFAREEVKNADSELASTRDELQRIRKERDEEKDKYSRSRIEVVKLKGDLESTAKDLRGVHGRLRNAENINAQNSRELVKLRKDVVENKTKLGVRERDYAELKDQLARKEEELLVERLKRQDAETHRNIMQDAMKDTVKQLSAKDAELAKSRQALAKKEGELEAAQKNGVGVAVPSETKVFERYAKAVIRFESAVSEKKWGGSRDSKLTSYYPVVNFGPDRVMIVGSLNRFAGDWDMVLKFEDVSAVKMTFAPLFGRDSTSPQLITDRMLVSSVNPHMAGFRYTGFTARPLEVLDAGQLQRFGVDDLYLFKSGNFEINTRLSGRVSLIPDENAPSIFIRNIGRAGLEAEQGDFILSSRGEFVGIVSEKAEINDSEGVKVLLIKDVKALWEQPAAVPLSKNPEEKYYSGYASAIKELRKKVKGGYERKR